MVSEGPLIDLDNIWFRYFGKIPAISGISLSIREGERVAVIGSNGSGKSTLLHILDGLVFPSEGTYRFRSREVTEASLRESGFLRYFRERVGYVFQDPDVQLFCPKVVDELLYGPLQMAIPEEEAIDRAHEVMRLMGIESLKERPTYMLSGGEKKRVAIGSVLTMNPEVLLLDEPTNGLDPRTQAFLVELILSLSEAGKTVVIASHDLSLVDDLEMRVVLLSEAHRVERIGPSAEILADTNLLLRANLIHEHRHFHGTEEHRHRHGHYSFHRHEPGSD
jgi:cobalt/nickel transport system ATP-binding protein